MSVVRVAGIAGCVAVTPAVAGTVPGRFFGAWASPGRAGRLLGQGVLDEFGTFSSPVLLCHPANLGRVYDAGLTLAHRRDPELPIDAGWPPLCLGTAALSPDLAAGWQERLLGALAAKDPDSLLEMGGGAASHLSVGAWQLTGVAWPDVAVVGTDAPLLPRQLRRLAAAVSRSLTVAFATGNRLTGSPHGAPLAVRVASEATVDELARAAGGLFA
jgi:hypothetical protein